MQDNNKPVHQFIILNKSSENPNKDFQQFLLELRQGWLINVIQNSETQVSISHNLGYASQLTLTPDENVNGVDYKLAIHLDLHAQDEVTLNSVRRTLLSAGSEYKIFSKKLNCFIPKDPEIVLDEIGSYNLDVRKILKQFDLNPIYYHQSKKIYYATNSSAQVHIINTHLLNFIYKKNIPESSLPELSYQVAKNLSLFTGMFDKSLIPTNFYQYYKRSTKIINDSHFNIQNPGRKVFVKPLILEFNQQTSEFYTYADQVTSSLLLMDKIRPRETLHQTILRVLREELKIADDYIGAYIDDFIEFDRDRDGKMTPRLIVIIYVDQIKNKEWATRMSQTSWRSMDGTLATPPPENKKD